QKKGLTKYNLLKAKLVDFGFKAIPTRCNVNILYADQEGTFVWLRPNAALDWCNEQHTIKYKVVSKHTGLIETVGLMKKVYIAMLFCDHIDPFSKTAILSADGRHCFRASRLLGYADKEHNLGKHIRLRNTQTGMNPVLVSIKYRQLLCNTLHEAGMFSDRLLKADPEDEETLFKQFKKIVMDNRERQAATERKRLRDFQKQFENEK
ncbi:hypothetical protein N9H09_02035, partial [bacterium]|nr:hypothetical protein [bacterium]